MPLKETSEVLEKLLLWGGIGALFTFIRLLVVQEAKGWRDFVVGIFIGACVGSLVGYSIEEYTLIGGIAPYVAISAILSEKIVLLIMRIGTSFSENPRSILLIIKELMGPTSKK